MLLGMVRSRWGRQVGGRVSQLEYVRVLFWRQGEIHEWYQSRYAALCKEGLDIKMEDEHDPPW